MTVLLADRARDDTLAYFKATVPAQIVAVNALRPTKHQLQADFTTYAGEPRLAKPESPTLYVLPSEAGFRGTNWTAIVQQDIQLDLCIEVGNQDEPTAMDDLLGYFAVVINAIRQFTQGTASMAHGQQILFGQAQDGQEQHAIRFQAQGSETLVPFYAQAIIPVTVIQDEAG